MDDQVAAWVHGDAVQEFHLPRGAKGLLLDVGTLFELDAVTLLAEVHRRTKRSATYLFQGPRNP
eukprot:626580-Amphidinium_carterae.1